MEGYQQHWTKDKRAGKIDKQDVIYHSPTQATYLKQVPNLKGYRVNSMLRETQSPEGI